MQIQRPFHTRTDLRNDSKIGSSNGRWLIFNSLAANKSPETERVKGFPAAKYNWNKDPAGTSHINFRPVLNRQGGRGWGGLLCQNIRCVPTLS
jgi:hypothetical protein